MRIGIIDLGSNTFHILIVEVLNHTDFKEIFRLRKFIGLSKGGTESLSEDRINEGLIACKIFKQKLEEFGVQKIKVVGTAILRSATNKMSFIRPCEEIFGSNIEIIDGDKEAELIYKGVSQLKLNLNSSVIIDIGGGSVEYILVEKNEMVWCKSFHIGVGVLHDLFHQQEPISELEVEQCKQYLHKTLSPLIEIIKDKHIDSLIGASGSFEVINMLNNDHSLDLGVPLNEIHRLSNLLINASLEERLNIEKLPKERAEFIVVAMILIQVSLDIIKPKEVFVSPFAIKEGLISEMIEIYD